MADTPIRRSKLYQGHRAPDGTTEVTVNGKPLPLCLEHRAHSPSEFEWGYCGSGPAQLSLALLVDHLHDPEQALALYQAFKSHTVSLLPQRGWILTSAMIDRALRDIQEQQGGQE